MIGSKPGMEIRLVRRRHCAGTVPYRLYVRSFPKSERKPAEEMERLSRSRRCELYSIMAGSRTAGIALLEKRGGLCLIGCLAVRRKFRGLGIGTAALEEIRKRHPAPERLVLEVDICRDFSGNAARISFYSGRGFVRQNYCAVEDGIPMNILSLGGSVPFGEYFGLKSSFMGGARKAHRRLSEAPFWPAEASPASSAGMI